jgi:hypothetical protein
MNGHLWMILQGIVLIGWGSIVPAASAAAAPESRSEVLKRPSGEHVSGRLVGTAASGFAFERSAAVQGAARIPLETGAVVEFAGTGPEASLGFPPFRLELGLGQRVSGRLAAIDAHTVRLDDGPGGRTIEVARPGVMAVVQRPGEAEVFHDGFETLDRARWTMTTGDPRIADEAPEPGGHSLRIPAGATSLTCRLAEPIGSGRLEVAFQDSGNVVPGQQWFVELIFRNASGSETVRAILGWSEESWAVESPGGPALAVQRLARQPGWHRLRLRFGPELTEVAVDGNELAHGKGVGRPLAEIRLASSSSGKADVPQDLAGALDDLRLARLAEPVGGLEVNVVLDEVRLVGGDQIFGTIRAADGQGVSLRAGGRDVSLPWSDVAGLYFRREPGAGRPITGVLARLEWRAAPGNDPRDLDRVEGVLTAVNDASVSLETPYAGVWTIPRDRLRRLRVLGRGTRLIIDPTAHHLGNDIALKPPLLDPPYPEGAVLERSFKLDKIPSGSAFLALDVVQVVGEAEGPPYQNLLRKGELRTNVLLNGKRIDYLNRYITGKNETPERIRLPIPGDLLRPGRNQLRIEQAGTANDPNYLDDLGLLGIAIEIDADRRDGS